MSKFLNLCLAALIVFCFPILSQAQTEVPTSIATAVDTLLATIPNTAPSATMLTYETGTEYMTALVADTANLKDGFSVVLETWWATVSGSATMEQAIAYNFALSRLAVLNSVILIIIEAIELYGDQLYTTGHEVITLAEYDSDQANSLYAEAVSLYYQAWNSGDRICSEFPYFAGTGANIITRSYSLENSIFSYGFSRWFAFDRLYPADAASYDGDIGGTFATAIDYLRGAFDPTSIMINYNKHLVKKAGDNKIVNYRSRRSR